MGSKMNKKAQVAIFIIIAILIVVAVVAFFLLRGRIGGETPDNLGPKAYIEKCVGDGVKLSVARVEEGGGRINPTFFKMYRGEEYNYLCYQKNYYLTCVNHYPQLKQIVESEIKEDVDGKVRECFVSLVEDYESRGYTITEGELDWGVELIPGGVKVNIDKNLEVAKGSSESYSDFGFTVLSPVNELVSVAREIVNQESQYCNFEYNGFMLLYPEYDIKRIAYDESLIYKVEDRRSGDLFKFAVRSCAFPPGL